MSKKEFDFQVGGEWLVRFNEFYDKLCWAVNQYEAGPSAVAALGLDAPELSKLRDTTRKSTVKQHTTSIAEKLIKHIKDDVPYQGLISRGPSKGSPKFESSIYFNKHWIDCKKLRGSLASELQQFMLLEATFLAGEQEITPDSGSVETGGVRAAVQPQRTAGEPSLGRVAKIEAQLEDQGLGNGGTFAQPHVSVQLIFGDETRPEVLVLPKLGITYAVLALSNCTLRVDYVGGKITPIMSGNVSRFRLQSLNSNTLVVEEITLELNPQILNTGPANWHAEPGRYRRLLGQSDQEFLCEFSSRPQQLSVSLLACPYDLRLERQADEFGERQREDQVDKVVALLARLKVLGENATDGLTLCQLDRKDLIV